MLRSHHKHRMLKLPTQIKSILKIPNKDQRCCPLCLSVYNKERTDESKDHSEFLKKETKKNIRRLKKYLEHLEELEVEESSTDSEDDEDQDESEEDDEDQDDEEGEESGEENEDQITTKIRH